MARDYKPRNKHKRQRRNNTAPGVTWWRWLLVILLIAAFAYFLSSLSDTTPEKTTTTQVKPVPDKPAKTEPTEQVQKEPELVEPEFDFYEILEDKEVRIPDYEVKTRIREEKVGKTKPAHYIIQVGAFREYKQADKLKARLAFMGIESKIEKAKVGDIEWNRLKIGPYAKMSTVERIRDQLKQKGMTAIVMEVQG
jgi:cell division protein FtsN